MEATLLGIPAMALSQDYRDGEPIPWQTGEALRRPRSSAACCGCLGREHTLFNINFPAAGAGARSRASR